MNNNIDNNSFNRNRIIQTPRENKFPDEIINDKKAKSLKKFNISKKNNPILFNNNINSINIINNNYNNIYLDTNKPIPNKDILLEDKSNLGLLTFGNVKEKSIKKSKALKLIFNHSIRDKEKFNENKYQYIIDRLKYEIDYYKNKSKVKSYPLGTNSPHSYRKKGINKNLFLASNKYNTIKTYDNNASADTKRKNKNSLYDTFNNKLITDFSYKNNLRINTNINSDINHVPKSNSNNLISINSNRIFKYANKRIKNEINQNPSLLGVNKSNNHISEEGVYETNMNTSGKSSFNNVHSYNIHVNSKICTPLSLKKNVKNINNIFKVMNKNKNYETDFNKDNYKDKFEILKNRMNRLIGNLFDIIDLQQHKLIEINNK